MTAHLRLLVALLLWSAASAAPRPADERNVLLVVLDDVGIEQIGAFGGVPPVVRAPLPNLDRLAAEGLAFHRAYGSPSCSPTRAMLQTGRYAFRTGIGRNSGQHSGLSLGEATIAEVLSAGAAGRQIACGMFGKWHLYRPAEVPLVATQGYQSFVGTVQNVLDHFRWDEISSDASGVRTRGIGSSTGPYDETTFSASVTRAEALRWINAQSSPFFACVAFHAPHDPLQVPPYSLLSAATAASLRHAGLVPGQSMAPNGGTSPQGYALLLEALDTEIGRLIDGIAPKLRERTTIFVVGDNGTPGPLLPPPHLRSRGKHSLYESGIRVPLIAAGYGVESCDDGSHALVSAVDLLPTIIDLMGCDAGLSATAGPLDGLSFARVLVDPSHGGERTLVFAQAFEPNIAYQPQPNVVASTSFSRHDRSISDGELKLLRRWNPVTRRYAEEAYLLTVDPLEMLDLHPSLAAGALAPELAQRIHALSKAMDQLSGR
jgi:arylsulfatase A-like enzyme